MVNWRLGAGALFLVAVMAAGLLLAQVAQARSEADSLRVTLAQTLTQLEDQGALLATATLRNARDHLQQAQEDVRAIQGRLGPLLFLAPYVGGLPFLGEDLVMAETLLDMTFALARGGEAALGAVLPLTVVVEEGSIALRDPEPLHQVMGDIEAARAAITRASQDLDRAQRLRADLRDSDLPVEVRASLQRLDRALPRFQRLLEASAPGLDIAETVVRAAGLAARMEDLAENPNAVVESEVAWTALRQDVRTIVTISQRTLESLDRRDLEALFLWFDAWGLGQEDVRTTIELVQALAQGTEATVQAISPTRDLFTGERFAFFRNNVFDGRFIQTVVQAAPDFAQAHEAFQRAEGLAEDLGKIEDMSGKAWVDQARTFLPKLLAITEVGAVADSLVPYFMGMDRPRHFVVLAQNADELRATGGFITGSWLISMDQGVMTRLRFFDNYEVDFRSTRLSTYPLAPPDLRKYAWTDIWIFIDANWFPDFPRTARIVQSMYIQGQGVRPDGVIALNQFGMRDLVGALGPITIPGDLGQVTAENFIPIMEAGTDQRGHAYMDDVFQELLGSLEDQISLSKLLDLALSLERTLEEKQALIFAETAPMKEVLRRQNWDGAIPEVSGDHLYVVDTNFGFDKVNRKVEQRLFYDISLPADGPAEAQLQVVYDNYSQGDKECLQRVGEVGAFYKDQLDSCYWDYTRVYIPGGSKLSDSTPLPVPENSLYGRFGMPPTGYKDPSDTLDTLRVRGASGKQEMSGFFLVPRGQKKTIAYSYLLPEGIVRENGDGSRTYSLYLQKQPGTLGHPYVVRVHLPKGARILDVQPSAFSITSSTVEIVGTLDRDTRVSVQFQRP